jgi:serine/threonine-protein kinase
MPPEAVSAHSGITTVEGDVYALGVTAYRLLNGDASMTPPSATTDVKALIAAGRYPDRATWQPHVHNALRRVVQKALHADPAKRYASAATLRHALEKARPTVSWWPTPAATGVAWEGAAADGTTWRAALEPRFRGGYGFTLERRLLGKAWRRQASDCLQVADEAAGLAYAAGILGRVAMDGPLTAPPQRSEATRTRDHPSRSPNRTVYHTPILHGEGGTARRSRSEREADFTAVESPESAHQLSRSAIPASRPSTGRA